MGGWERLRHFSVGARFLNEARAIDVVDHPGVVKIFDIGTLPTGQPYIAMELLAGESLRERLNRQKGSLGEQTLPLVKQVAQTLAAVHAKKIIHRDLKPENVMLTGSDEELRCKVLDFGIAKWVQSSQAAEQVKTRTGVLIGTPTYMAPEQCGGDGEVCDRTDVYALGVMLYELLAGRPPFTGTQDAQLIGKHLFGVPTPLVGLVPGIDARLNVLVMRMLAKAPPQRPTMKEVAGQLEQLHGVASLGVSDPSVSGVVRTVMVRSEPRHTTLGNATGATGQSRRRQLTTLALAALGLVVVLGVGLALRPRPAPPAAPAVVPSAAPGAVEPGGAQPAPVATAPAEVKPVRKSVRPVSRPISRPISRPVTRPGSRPAAAVPPVTSKPLRNDQVPLFH